jgi:carboxyl-terminal processing protease
MKHLIAVIDSVTKYYYKSIDASKLIELAIKGMLVQLDPHSEYLDAEGLRDLKMETTGKFGGIGVQIVPENGAIKVVTPLDGTPAYRAGIKPGDYIIQINDKSVADMTLSEARNLMCGSKGSKLSLVIVRKDRAKPLFVNLKREIIYTQSTIKSSLLEVGYGYIRLAVFQESTEQDLIKAIKRLQKMSRDGLKGIVIDVRNNPGGLVDSAVNIANDFLDPSLRRSCASDSTRFL